MNRIAFFQGTFDLVNAGHTRAFRLAKDHCEVLIVGLNSDRVVREERQRDPVLPYEQRREILEGNRHIDVVIPCDGIYALPFIEQLGATVYVITDEWSERQATAIRRVESKGGTVIFMPRFPDVYCGTDIRNRIKELT